jgi:DNA-binding NtrC family response regulator
MNDSELVTQPRDCGNHEEGAMAADHGKRAEETTALRATTYEPADGTQHAALVLHVVRDGRVTTVPLPEGKTLTVGRSVDADLVLEETSVSRRHLAIEVGARVVLRDLESANGVRIGTKTLGRGEAVPVEPGAVIEVGSALLVVQRAGSVAPPRRVWSHGYFEGRVQDECARAEQRRGSFAVLRVRLASKENESRALDALSRDLKPADVLALYGPGELEALLLEASARDVGAQAGHLDSLFAELGIAATVAAAEYPGDGRSADALMAVAGERLAGKRERPVGRVERGTYGRHLAELEGRLIPIARSNMPVLIFGETGVGKEIVAEMVHRLSPRAQKPLVRINCGAFTETLLASELFGYERGAFTGADRAKAGLLESADEGTIFLDEIGELPLALQPKLLRVLEGGEVLRVGAVRPKHIDVRFVCATHRDLEAEAERGTFRKDLYFRLAAHTEVVLPLRERPGEIPDIVRGLLDEAARAAGVPTPEVEPDAMRLLERYTWPGNVRELRNVVQRALLLSQGSPIGVAHLPADRLTMRTAAPPRSRDTSSLELALQAHERQRIVAELERCGGNQTHAARALGMARGTLLARMDAFGLTRPRKRPRPGEK